MEVQQLIREFNYNGVALPDPGPQYGLEQVREFYAAMYPEITSAAIEGPENIGAKTVYTFRRAVGTKGNDGVISHWRDEPAPTHRCKVCGALWRFWRKEEVPGSPGDSWNLRSANCGKCCDTAPMGEQIEPLTLGEMEKYLAARLAVDAMTQHVLGPKNGERVN